MAKSKKTKKAKLKEKKALKKSQKQPAKKKSFDKPSFIVAIAIVLLTLFAFSTAINNNFVNWDDDRNFTENQHITSLNDTNFWSNTKEIFTSRVIGGYNPLTIFTFALDKKFHGFENPSAWHLENVLLHLLCTFLVFFIARKLGLKLFGAALVAILFGIHPMRVESVAWVTERKDVLFGSFYLMAFLYYLKYIREEKKKSYLAIIWVCFILSLFSKIQAVILPISMVLADYYFDGKLDFKKILRKAPFFLASFAFGILGILFLDEQGSLETNNSFAGIQRLFVGSWQYTVYLVKSVFPYRLSPLYPYPASMPWYFYLSFLSFIGSAALMFVAYKKQWKVVFFGLGFFIANVFFLLQILGAGQGFLADRFTYIAYLGLFFIFAYYLENATESFPKFKMGIYIACGIILAGYAFMTFNQNKIWKDSGTLWTHVLKYYTKSTLPYGNRANFYRDNGQKVKALADYNNRIKLKQDDAGVFNSRGRLYFNSSNKDTLQLALNDYNKAIELEPSEAEYWVNLGATYAKLGDFNSSLKNLNKGIELNPNFVNAYLNRSVIHNTLGNYEPALSDITNYLKFKPYNSDMWYEKSRLENMLKQPDQALQSSSNAIKYNGKQGMYHIEKAKALYTLKRFPEAKQSLATAQRMGAKVDQKVLSVINGSN